MSHSGANYALSAPPEAAEAATNPYETLGNTAAMTTPSPVTPTPTPPAESNSIGARLVRLLLFNSHWAAGFMSGFTAELLFSTLETESLWKKATPGAPFHDKTNKLLRFGSHQLKLPETKVMMGRVAKTTAPMGGLVLANYELAMDFCRQQKWFKAIDPVRASFFSGAAAGVLETVMWHPVIVIRGEFEERMKKEVARQAEKAAAAAAAGVEKTSAVAGEASLAIPRGPSTTQLFRQSAHHLFTTGGYRAFYRGWASTCLQTAPFLSVYFGTGAYITKKYTSWGFSVNPYANFMIGGTACVVGVVVTTPLEILRAHVVDIIRRTQKEKGLSDALHDVKLKDQMFKKAPRSAIKKAMYPLYKKMLLNLGSKTFRRGLRQSMKTALRNAASKNFRVQVVAAVKRAFKAGSKQVLKRRLTNR